MSYCPTAEIHYVLLFIIYAHTDYLLGTMQHVMVIDFRKMLYPEKNPHHLWMSVNTSTALSKALSNVLSGKLCPEKAAGISH